MKKRMMLTVTFLMVFLFAFQVSAAEKKLPTPKSPGGVAYNEENVIWNQTGQGWTCTYKRTGETFADRWANISHKEGTKQVHDWYYFNEHGIMQTGWLFWDNDWFYLRPDGRAIRKEGFQEIDGFTYYFSAHGTLYVNETMNIDGKTYTFDEKGHIVNSGEDKSAANEFIPPSKGDQIEYINFFRKSKGISLLTHDRDFDKVAEKAFYDAQSSGHTSLSKVYSIAVEDGHPVNHIAFIYASASKADSYVFLTGEAEALIRNLWYTRVGYYKQGTDIMIILASYEGEGATQLSPDEAQGLWIQEGANWKYRKIDNTFAVSCWVKTPKDGKWYHFDENGYMQTGWLEDQDGKWYYLNPANGEMMTNTTIDGRTLGKDGSCI